MADPVSGAVLRSDDVIAHHRGIESTSALPLSAAEHCAPGLGRDVPRSEAADGLVTIGSSLRSFGHQFHLLMENHAGKRIELADPWRPL